MNIEEILAQRINVRQVKDLSAWAIVNRIRLDRLWCLVDCSDIRISRNALWTITYLKDADPRGVSALRDSMIDYLLVDTDNGRKRMLMQILSNLDYDQEDIRTDFLDWCLSRINSESEPYAIRAYSIYAAFKMCRHYRELIDELVSHLDMLSYQQLYPGLRSALRQTRNRIGRLQ